MIVWYRCFNFYKNTSINCYNVKKILIYFRNRNKEIDTIEYKESPVITCFQRFSTVYRYKGKVVRTDVFIETPLIYKTLNIGSSTNSVGGSNLTPN